MDNADDVSADDANRFCTGMFMTMSMGGFQSTFFSGGRAGCISFLFTDFRLDNSGKFFFAMLCTFFLAVFSEGMSCCQSKVGNYYLLGKPKYFRKTIMALLYGIQQCFGWLLMLISMTFSIELFASVVLGICAGKALFPIDTPATGLRRIRRGTDGSQSFGNNTSSNSIDRFSEEEDSTGSSPSAGGSSTGAIRRRRR